MRIAKVIPIFKTGDPTVLSNYRPVSVLLCLSKVLGRIMYNRLYSLIKEFGFRKYIN